MKGENFINLNEYSPLVLSYLGDAVIELIAREKLVINGNIPPEKLHLKAQMFVRATSQAKAVERVLPHLTEREVDIYKRGRNAKGRHPKSASVIEYKMATGMECLFGYMHMSGEIERLRELFDIAFRDIVL